MIDEVTTQIQAGIFTDLSIYCRRCHVQRYENYIYYEPRLSLFYISQLCQYCDGGLYTNPIRIIIQSEDDQSPLTDEEIREMAMALEPVGIACNLSFTFVKDTRRLYNALGRE